MTTATVTKDRISRWTMLLLVGVVDAIAGAAGVLATSGAALVASWVLLVAGVDIALFAWWSARRSTAA